MQQHTQDEVWLPVVGYEGCYEVSSLGNVRSLPRLVTCRNGQSKTVRGRALRPHIGQHVPYRTVRLCKGNRHSTQRIYRLVAEAFIGPLPAGMHTCHNNSDSTDDRAANLRYDTPRENARDVVRAHHHHEQQHTHCPHGHLLAQPNLRSRALTHGTRACLACHRASGWVSKDPENRRAHKRSVADARYIQIMKGTA